MSARVRHGWRWLAFAGALALGGCGGDARWDRWQVERAVWHAERQVARLRLDPALASPDQWEAAGRAYRAIAARWPAETWVARAAAAGAARDVALTAGQAAVDGARLDELRGRPDAALEGYARAGRAWAALEPVAVEAGVARARLLGVRGREREAAEAWLAVAAFAPLDGSGRARTEVLDAPLSAAHLFADHGDEAAADSVLRAAQDRLERLLSGGLAPTTAIEVGIRLGEARASLGDAPGAFAALRAVLARPEARARAPRTVLLLARRALDLQRPDSALAYARWARDRFGPAERAEGMRLVAEAWEGLGRRDSALVAWGDVVEAFGDTPGMGAEARSRRARLYESLGSWEQARTEYRTLVSAEPTHPLAFDALLRMVTYHAERGEHELARLAGASGIETLDRVIATRHDLDVSFGARRARAAILESLGDAGAERALADVWRAGPDRPGASQAALAAARRALARPGGRALAESLYRDVAARSVVDAARRAAQAALESLRNEHTRGDR